MHGTLSRVSDVADASLDPTVDADVTPDTTPAPAPSAQPPNLKAAVAFAGQRFDVDPGVLAGIAMRESSLDPDVISGARSSSAGAIGLMQFMPDTAQRYGIDPTDPVQSIIGAAAYLHDNLQKFNGDYARAIAGYNWGENHAALDAPDWKSKLPDETRNYVGFVLNFAAAMAKNNPPAASAAAPNPSTPYPGNSSDDNSALYSDAGYGGSPAATPDDSAPAVDSGIDGIPSVALPKPVPQAGAGRGNINPPNITPGRDIQSGYAGITPGESLSPLPDVAPTLRDRIHDAFASVTGSPTAEQERQQIQSARASNAVAVGAGVPGGPSYDQASEDARQVVGGMSQIPEAFASGAISAGTLGLAQPDVPMEIHSPLAGVAKGAGQLAGFVGGAPLAIATKAAEATGLTALLAPAADTTFGAALVKDAASQAITLGSASALQDVGSATLDSHSAVEGLKQVGTALAGGLVTGGLFGAAGRILPDGTVGQWLGRALGVGLAQDMINGTRPDDDRPAAQKAYDYLQDIFFTRHGAGRLPEAAPVAEQPSALDTAVPPTPAADPIHAILDSDSVDDAAAAAAQAITTPAPGSIAAQMRAIRPLATDTTDTAPLEGPLQAALRNAGLADKELNDGVGDAAVSGSGGGSEPALDQSVGSVADTGRSPDESVAAVPEPSAPDTAPTVDAGPVAGDDGAVDHPPTAIWRSPSGIDYPVLIGDGTHAGPDGKQFQAVLYQGRKTFVPADEITNRSDSPNAPTPETPAAERAPEPAPEQPPAEAAAAPAAPPTLAERIEAMRAPAKPGLADRVEAMRAKPEPAIEPTAEPEQVAAFKRDQQDETPAAATDPRTAMVQDAVDRIKSTWKNAPDVIIAKNLQDEVIPPAVRAADQRQRSEGAQGDVEGFLHKPTGKVYLMSDAIHNEAQAAKVMLHESLGHYGLRGVFGDKLNVVLDRVALLNPKAIAAKAPTYGDVSTLKGRRVAAEEVLAELAGTNPKAGVVQQALAVVKSWLRENIPALAKMKLSDAEMVRDYLQPAKNWVLHGKELDGGADAPSLQDRVEATRTKPEDTAAFKNWFGQSKVLDEQGKPKVMYHGTSGDFNSFDPSAGKDGKGAKTATFLTHDPETAHQYAAGDLSAATVKPYREDGSADTTGANIMPVYAKAESPFDHENPSQVKGVADRVFDKTEQYTQGDGQKALVLDGVRTLYTKSVLEAGLKEGTWSLIEKPEIQAAIKAQGHDAFWVKEAGQRNLGVYSPEQIKSATGNRGTFDATNPDIRFSRANGGDDTTNFSRAKAEAAPEKEEEPRTRLPGAQMLDDATTKVSELIDHGLDDIGVYGMVAPMSAGTSRTRAMAQAHINAERLAKHQWQTMENQITKGFTRAQRTTMWKAADQQNDILQRGGKVGPNEGINALPADQRAVVETMHAYSKELWKRAQEVGLVEGDGVKFWAPRMMAMVDDAGEFSKPSEPGQKATSDGVGRNIVTTSPSTKARKYDTSAESAAAMKAKGGQLVEDIRTMPLAMARFERAIAGRELINQIKDLGKVTGKETVSTSMEPGFFTLNHPAFTTFEPRMVDGGDGKMVPAVDQNGKTVMDRKPLFISNEFKGPLKAIMTDADGPLYRGYMLLKSKAMSLIMASPLQHNMVIAGRAFSYAGLKLPALYFTGHLARKDPELMSKAIGAGMVPISGANHSMIDVGDIARGIGKEGGWGDPNESWLGLGVKKVGNMAVKGLGDAGKAGIDKLGTFVHGTLLWDRIGDLQMGIFKDAYNKALAKGADDNGAATYAAHMANRYAGAVGRENMSAIARKFANVLLFSRSFNMGNIGAVKDVVYGLPAGLKAQLVEGSSPESARLIMSMAKRKAFTGLVTDLAATVLITSMVQDIVRRNKDDPWAKQLSDAMGGYSDRAKAAWENVKAHPGTLDSYNAYRFSSTWQNEPGKRNRVDLGAQPNGRHEYMRLPTGKVVEDTINWLSQPGDTLAEKMSPMARATAQVVMNNKGYGTPVWDPNGTLANRAMDMALHFLKSQTPWDTIQTGYDLANGKATPLDKEKLQGNLTGLSISQGNPKGPAGAVEQQVQDRVETSKKYVMEAVTRDLKYGDDTRARARLQEIGLTDAEIGRIVNKTQGKIDQAPSQQSVRQKYNDMLKFKQHATDAEKATMDEVNH